MRRIVSTYVLLLASSALGQVAAPPVNPTVPAGSGEGLFSYQSEQGDLGFQDILHLSDGRQLTGRAMEWADQFLLYDAAGHVRVFEASQIKECEYRRALRHAIRPALPDLTVAYVERLPRDQSFQGAQFSDGASPESVMVAPGQKVVFRAHILNAGTVKTIPVSWKMSVSGTSIASGELPELTPGREQVIEGSWSWDRSPQTLQILIDPEKKQREIARWNNTFTEPTAALGVAVVVDRDRYDAFAKTPNIVDSICFEDWIQYQLRSMNALMAESVYPTAPRGVLERVRCDRIIVVNNAMDPQVRDRWSAQLRSDGGRAEESALLVFGKPAASEDIASTAIKMDWPQLKELGRELGLVALQSTDTALEACHVLDQYERYAVCQHFFPWPRTLMYTPGPFRLDELSCNYLNQVMGKPRGFRGEYLYQLPSKIILEVRSNSGAPVTAQIDAFQLQSEGEAAGFICGAGRDPLYSATTGPDGRLELPNLDAPPIHTPHGYKLGPNPFGKIVTDGSNGLLLFRIRHTHESIVREEFHFLRLYDCNLAYIRGDHDSHVHAINTRFPDPDAPLAPPFTLVVMDDRSTPKPPLKLRWRTTTSLLKLDEYRVYQRVGLGGDSETPWTLASVVRKTDKRWILEADVPYFETPPPGFQYSLDTYFAIVAVDKHGRESGLGGQTFLTAGKDGVKMAIDVDNAFMTLRGRGIVPMLHWDGNIGTQPFLVNTSSVKNYHPTFAGIAVTPEHLVLISDPANHVLGVYDLSGNLEALMPRRPFWPGFASDKPGEFNDPADVAVDKQGRIYVADRGNDRVQMLDSQGKFLANLDEQTRLLAPSAVACSNNHLCVTDRSGSRIRIYKIDGAKPAFEREIIGLVNADRAVLNLSGKVFVTAQDPQSLKQAVLVFGLKDDALKLESARFEGEMGKLFDPRGGYLYDYLPDNFLYVLNAFPFDLRRIKME